MFDLNRLHLYSRYKLLENLHARLVGLDVCTKNNIHIHECDWDSVQLILEELDRRLGEVAFTKKEKEIMDLDEYLHGVIEKTSESIPGKVIW